MYQQYVASFDTIPFSKPRVQKDNMELQNYPFFPKSTTGYSTKLVQSLAIYLKQRLIVQLLNVMDRFG